MRETRKDPRKLVIIGAPRSGTNMLRDILCEFDGVATWPCDEINPVWRHGNVDYPHDQIPPSAVSGKTRRYINRKFADIARRYSAHTVVEKTCANSLRADFVNEVLPDARFIYIVRDGLDAVGSARLRWKSDFDLLYTLRKVRFVPITDFPVYLLRFFRNRLYRVLGREKRLGVWGPVFPGIDEALGTMTLDEVCALQWQACVDRSDECLAMIDASRVHYVRYEDFVRNPEAQLASILDFAGIASRPEMLKFATRNVSAGSLGKGRARFDVTEQERLAQLVGNSLERHGYPR